MVLLSEQLKGFSAVNVAAETVADVFAEILTRYGPVNRSQFSDFQDALNYLLPLKSFPTRFLVLGLNGWSVLLTGMRGEGCYVDAYGISRKTGCNGIGVILQADRRELHLYENGKPVREVHSLLDGDRWYFTERGPLQPFEDIAEYLHKKKKLRLSVEALHRYFQTYTGFPVPDWKSEKWTQMLGLERSWKEARVPMVTFETINDLW